MIDTVIVHIENLHYPSMINFVNKVESLRADVELTETSFANLTHVRLKRFDTDKDFIKGKFYASSGYALNWFYNKKENLIKLNFSIPKLLYGNNVLMWFPHERIYSWTDIDLKILNKEFLELIESTVLLFSTSQRMDNQERQNISIKRIDMCFNYVFRNTYLRDLCYESILTKRKKYAKIGDHTISFKNSTMMYKTKKYSVKYYKKDHEFKKFGLKQFEIDHGLKKADRINNLAKRTLRFEVSMRNLKLSWDFRKYVINSLLKLEHDEQTFKSCNFKLLAPKIDLNIETFLLQKDFNISEHFWTAVINSFLDMLDEWKVETFVSDEKFLQAVEHGKKMFPKMRWNRFYNYWSQLKTMSIDEMVEKNIIHRNSKANIIKAFNIIGINLKTIGNQDFEYIPDFYDYIRATEVE